VAAGARKPAHKVVHRAPAHHPAAPRHAAPATGRHAAPSPLIAHITSEVRLHDPAAPKQTHAVKPAPHTAARKPAPHGSHPKVGVHTAALGATTAALIAHVTRETAMHDPSVKPHQPVHLPAKTAQIMRLTAAQDRGATATVKAAPKPQHHDGGLFGDIWGAVSDAATGHFSSAIHKASSAAHDLGHDVVQGAKTGVHLLKAAGKALGHARDNVEHAIGHGFMVGVKAIGHGVVTAAKWSWHHPSTIAMGLGIAAMIAATPLTGGASDAAAAGMIAGEAGADGAVAASGAAAAEGGAAAAEEGGAAAAEDAGAGIARQGISAAAKGARTVARGAKDVSRPARLGVRDSIRGARMSFGRTPVGRGLLWTRRVAGRPTAIAANTYAGINFGQQVHNKVNGQGSWLGVGLSGLGFVGGLGAGTKVLGLGKFAKFGAKGAGTADRTTGTIVESASKAQHLTTQIADAAPDTTAGEAAKATAIANDVGKTVKAKAQTVLSDGATAKPGSGVGPAALRNQMRTVAHQADTALKKVESVQHDGRVDDGMAAQAITELRRTRDLADTTANRLDPIVEKAEKAGKVAEVGAKAQRRAGTTAWLANIITESMRVDDQRNQGRIDWKDIVAMFQQFGSRGLGRNAKGMVAVPAGAGGR
jgi:hypothetical protein